ncbi:amino acid adenylation domain-containing protein [Xenorhabdus cabanillasii]|uniref:Amino acid adenylation domain-containing protein n=1 Tax=Xenorhabdus cabanillasii TaxID=351673 RepID=A0A3D9UDG2_9GAMM|nr:non-ribosomal peptide synthetase [Xenorhabdus cabanillasii]REF26403.1 amino acid adenylation domain-containing protein [Xenorhabdus cabanillasii]
MDNKLGEMIQSGLRKNPENIAIQSEFLKLTYKELADKVEGVSNLLINKRITKHSCVIVELKRNIDCICYILALVNIGSAYVPVDPAHSKERKEFIKQDVGADFIISTNSISNNIEVMPLIAKNNMAIDNSQLPHIAYILYTSGTTGNPKGVKIKSSAVANLLSWMTETYGFNNETRIINKTALTFDASVWEIFISFFCGGTLFLADPDKDKIPRYLAETINKFNINTVQFVPAMLKKVLKEPAFKECRSLKNVFTGGETLASELAKSFFNLSDAALHNLYGPTETTIQVLTHTVTKTDLLGEIPIGKPVANVLVYIVTQDGKEAAVDEIGELCISGIALAEGYVHRETEESQKFVSMYSLPGAPFVYKTGDFAYRNAFGDIFFCGRIDEQIKVNGYRVDLNEIETVLNNHTSIDTAIVTKESRGEFTFLIAYLKCHQENGILFEQVNERIQNTLPHYMWPSDYYLINDVPLTAHGKIDRKALSVKLNKIKLTPTKHKVTDLNNELKISVLKIWRDVLNNDEIELDSDFYSCGGNSIEAMIISMKLNEQLGINLTFEDVLKLRNVINIVDSVS